MKTQPIRPIGHEGDTMEQLTPIGTVALALSDSVRESKKHLATAVLIFSLGIVAVHGQSESVKMTFSGTSVPSTINLQQPNTSNDGDNFAGNGSWVHLPLQMYERSQILRGRPALARARICFFSQNSPVRVCSASTTAVYCKSLSRREAIA